VRQLRSFIPMFGLYFIVLFAVGKFPNFYRNPRTFVLKVVIGFAGLIMAQLVLNVRARRALKQKGLAPSDIHRVALSIPPSRVSFWARPHIAAILGPVRPPDGTNRADTPHDQLQSILRHAGELSGPLRPLGAQAAVAARQLLASIDDADREIRDLARNIDPAEDERLREKIAALGDDEAYAPLRALLEKQAELIRGLSDRIEVAKERRNQHIEMLKTLTLHVASLRARTVETPSEIRLLSDRVRTLCDEISQQAITSSEIAATQVKA
jgi:hypothetical protein